MILIYLYDSYQRDFHAAIQSVSGGRINLNQTAFYPQSGGQPSDGKDAINSCAAMPHATS